MDKQINQTVSKLSIESIISYLQLNQWKLEIDNNQWIVFLGNQDVNGDPFEIVLPKNTDVPDYQIYIKNTINTLSGLMNKTVDEVAEDILFYDRDILLIRVVERASAVSIPIDIAAKQIAQLKQLIGYAACSEKDPKPHFNAKLNVAKRMEKHYQFGHTFSGSFGYRIESPVGDQSKFVQKNLFENEPDEIILPLERRVMERILRGLVATQRASEQRDIKPLIDTYGQGFNSNMCGAILNISDSQSQSIEYRIKWSKKIESSRDIRNVNSILIRNRHYEYLQDARDKLKELEPEFIDIEGRVIGLSSQDDPLSTKVAEREIIVRWNLPTGRSRNVRVFLEREDYVIAHTAHLEWNTISVSGVIQRVGSNWQLSEPSDFRILR